MNYIALSDFKKAWVFRHQDLPIAESDLDQIKPMTAQRAAVLWSTMVSREQDHPDFFTPNDWVGKEENWEEVVDWEQTWEEGAEQLPEPISQYLNWEDNTTVYFCLSREHVIETQFGVFKRCWQNFMFLVDGSLLLGKKRDAAVQFLESGEAKLGQRPKGN
ncbi:DUF2947 domain-containing protein [Pseudoalteromonas sp. SMS1]|uniref:DUF2947 family protein n=1 Tax=Pseudoalteromonas sp. SMS1 TaxID=2908894 RepID=UPI001F2A59F3|nr:DUF2947 family protein [Pseudoalteromonas sp. SMS1]MCF2858967.1 DUF2947 domain-containing protein [Pseudoalteromonas sp. SMS1]